MDETELQLSRFLNGEPVSETVRKCDVEIDTGYEQLAVKQNICYIVAALILNDDNEVLIVQEAKPSCYQKWYLPAGRIEPNETIVDAVRREVREEAGLGFEPKAIICVEECGGRWVRFTLTGKISGGKLKSVDEADEESLQAMWWDRKEPIALRCRDILPLIDIGMRRQQLLTDSFAQGLLPANQPQYLLFLRVVLVLGDSSSDENYHILLHSNSKESKIPTTRVHPEDASFHRAVKNLLLQAVDADNMLDFKIICVLGIEHSGGSLNGLDGLGVNILVKADSGTQLLRLHEDFRWLPRSHIKDESTARSIKQKSSHSPTEHLVVLRSLRSEKKPA